MTKDDPAGEKPAQSHIDEIQKFRQRCMLATTGSLPSVWDLLAGCPFAGGDIDNDIRLAIDEALLGDIEDVFRAPLEHARSTCSLNALRVIWDLADARAAPVQPKRLQLWMAHKGAREIARDLGAAALGSWQANQANRMQHIRSNAYAIALLDGRRVEQEDMVNYGLAVLRTMQDVGAYDDAIDAVDHPDLYPKTAEPGLDEVLDLVEEDRAEIAPVTGVVVVPKLDHANGKMFGWRKELAKSWDGIAGERIEIHRPADLRQCALNLMAAWPHCADVIATVLTDLASSDHIKPTLFVGNPGAGKSSLARAIATELDLPVELHTLAGASDSSLMGTSAQWSSAREHVCLQLIKRSGCANVAVIWDEVEKASPERHNGSALDALLGVLEADQARAYRDPCLEVEVDLSHVSHMATANDVDAVPKPLRDRMRIIVVPEPTWQHVGILSRRILDRLAQEGNRDPRWHEDLAGDELEVLRANWNGGSIRKLRRAIEAIVSVRERHMGRA